MAFQYILFNKPFKVLSQFSPDGDKETLANYLKGIDKDIYPVGRLDFESEGLLLLTNDKQLQHELTEPKFGHKRTYWVQVDGEITNDAIQQLQKGVIIKHNGKQYETKPAVAKKLKSAPKVWDRNPPIRFRANIPTSWLQLTLVEGKNRQVRKMTAAVGFPTLRLIRCGIEKLSVEGLQVGEYLVFDDHIKRHLNMKK